MFSKFLSSKLAIKLFFSNLQNWTKIPIYFRKIVEQIHNKLNFPNFPQFPKFIISAFEFRILFVNKFSASFPDCGKFPKIFFYFISNCLLGGWSLVYFLFSPPLLVMLSFPFTSSHFLPFTRNFPDYIFNNYKFAQKMFQKKITIPGIIFAKMFRMFFLFGKKKRKSI